MQSVIKIPSLSTEISRHAKQALTDNGRTTGPHTEFMPPLITGGGGTKPFARFPKYRDVRLKTALHVYQCVLQQPTNVADIGHH